MTSNYEPMWHWVREREAIRVRKEGGDPFPWTDDPILREWRFCCVRREDDRVTRWVRENIRERFADHPDLWFMLCATRAINWPDTLAEMIDAGAWPNASGFSPKLMGEALEHRAMRGEKVFTGAYLITAPPIKGAKKTTFVAERTLGALWAARDRLRRTFIDPNTSLSYAHGELTRFNGWGPFMAYQAIVDMRFCPSLLAGARDVAKWAAAGPGTLRGLNRVHGRAIDTRLNQRGALEEMRRIFEALPDATGVAVDLSDVPNVLCETDKYLRVKNGEGTPRARYIPGRGS